MNLVLETAMRSKDRFRYHLCEYETKPFGLELEELFAACNTSKDTLMDKQQFRPFIEGLQELGKKWDFLHREVTDEYIDRLWSVYEKYELEEYEFGIITKKSLYTVTRTALM